MSAEENIESEPGARAENRATRVKTRSSKQATEDQVDMSRAAEKLSDKSLIQSRLDGLQALLDNSGDFQGFTAGLAQLAADAAPAELADVLARGGFAAQLAGRTPSA